MQDFKYLHRRPDKVIVRGSKYGFRSTVKGVLVHEGFTISVTVTNGSFSGDSEIVEDSGTATVTIIPSEGYVLPETITVTGASYEYDSSTGVVSLSEASGNVAVTAVCESSVVVDPVLANNSWETIRAVCEAGNAANYWSIGDVKSVTGGDNSARNVAIMDMTGLYNKHVVFQFLALSNNAYKWDEGGSNDYAASDMNVTHLASGGNARGDMVDSELSAQLTPTTFKVAENGNSSTVVEVTNELFLPAEKELGGSSYSRAEEQAALTTFAYWSTHSSSPDRTLKSPSDGSAHSWWERSPYSGSTNFACDVTGDGNFNDVYVTFEVRVAPCFAF